MPAIEVDPFGDALLAWYSLSLSLFPTRRFQTAIVGETPKRALQRELSVMMMALISGLNGGLS